MSIYDAVIEDTCPKCGNTMYSEGVNNGIGYVYPPFHCECGWSEMCPYEDINSCKKCDQYEFCFREEK